MGLAQFRVDTTQPGRPQLTVNGEDLSSIVSSVTFQASAGEVPKILVEVLEGGVVEGEGIVIVPTHPDLAGAMTQWVGSLDPAELERLILAESAGLGGGTTGEAIVEVLGRLLRGD